MRCVSLLCVLSAALGGRAATPEEDQAKAALALARASRERAAVKMADVCYANAKVAAEKSERSGKPLVFWVGMDCSAVPGVRQSLPDAIHCHLPELNGDSTPRVVINQKNGDSWRLERDQLTAEAGRAAQRPAGRRRCRRAPWST